jgi:hypothetical protein
MDPYSLSGVGSRVVGDGFCVQIVDDYGVEPDSWAVVTFERYHSPQEVVARIVGIDE